MKSERKYCVVGVRENGERVVITRHTSREIAERVVNLISVGSAFAELKIETDGGCNEPSR